MKLVWRPSSVEMLSLGIIKQSRQSKTQASDLVLLCGLGEKEGGKDCVCLSQVPSNPSAALAGRAHAQTGSGDA